MSQVTFEVLDQACEASNRTFFPPQIKLVTVSTTKIGTLLGFSEYIASTPPKKYRRLTWSGFSEQQLWNSGIQMGGARFDYSGSSEIDLNGNYTSLYSKSLSEMCNAADGLITTILSGPLGNIGYSFLGWCGPGGHQKCSPCAIPYSDEGNRAIGKGDAALQDRSFLWGSQVSPGGRGVQVSNFTVTSSTTGQCVDAGTSPAYPCFFEPIQPNSPLGTNVFPGTFIWNHNYSSLLDEEYTESDALANGKSYTGNGSTASHTRNGFQVSQTSVAFSLNASGLIPGQAYVITYELFDLAGVITPVSASFTATGTTFATSGVVPIPALGHSIQIRNAKITFA